MCGNRRDFEIIDEHDKVIVVNLLFWFDIKPKAI